MADEDENRVWREIRKAGIPLEMPLAVLAAAVGGRPLPALTTPPKARPRL